MSAVSLDYEQLKKFKTQIMLFGDPFRMDEYFEACAKELAARLLRKVIKRTPVGDYSREITVTAKRDSKSHKKGDQYTVRVTTGKVGGTLRRGWTVKTQEEAENGNHQKDPDAFVKNTLKVEKHGSIYMITVSNPVEYSQYVEFGHRTRNHKGWVDGKFMLTISEKEIQSVAPAVLEKMLKELIKKGFE